MSDAEKIALLDRFAAAWNAHDVDALMECMVDGDDCAFYGAAGGTPRGGQAGCLSAPSKRRKR